MRALVGIYKADGGLVGELRYALGKLRRRDQCSLCDLTHGALRPKASFQAVRARLGVPFELVHRNEDLGVEGGVGSELPCVMAEVGGRLRPLLGPADLAACAGDVDAFDQALRAAVEAHDWTLP